ncbi:LAGLIDADG homing endonuclease [Staphylococcus phage MarsHill]|nr:LAGLIDADG homing endonuclease [Staphylococcus phage MarsHill]
MEKEKVNSIILGSLLGDGHIEAPRGNNVNPSLGFTQESIKEVEYINRKYNIISEYYKTNKVRKGHFNTLRFSISSKEKELIRNMIEISRYEDNSRRLPDIKFIDPIVLLFWYIDDGSLSVGYQKRPNNRKPTLSRRLKITLASYKDEDIEKFVKEVNEKFNLNFKVMREKGKIKDIGMKKFDDILDFLDLIRPYFYLIPKENQYKFCICYKSTRIFNDLKYERYNMCDFHNTKICECRNKDLTLIG